MTVDTRYCPLWREVGNCSVDSPNRAFMEMHCGCSNAPQPTWQQEPQPMWHPPAPPPTGNWETKYGLNCFTIQPGGPGGKEVALTVDNDSQCKSMCIKHNDPLNPLNATRQNGDLEKCFSAVFYKDRTFNNCYLKGFHKGQTGQQIKCNVEPTADSHILLD